MFQPTLSQVNPRAILHKLFNISKINCMRKNLSLILEIDKNLPKLLLLDGTRFSQVLINIVSNSIKFTETGYVKIKVTWEFTKSGEKNLFRSEYSNYLSSKPLKDFKRDSIKKDSDQEVAIRVSERFVERAVQTNNRVLQARNGEKGFNVFDPGEGNFECEYHGEYEGTLLIEIEDSGIGISAKNLGKLFTPFVQANAGISKNFGGTGLGLWISKTILEVYKGEISAKSELAKGCNFTIKLPCKVKNFSDVSNLKLTQSGEKITAFLLDSLNISKNKKLLEDYGITTTACISVTIAVKYLETTAFHLIFIVGKFLNENSYNLINRIKRQQQENNSLLIILGDFPGTPKFLSVHSSPLLLLLSDLTKFLSILRQSSDAKLSGLVLILDDDLFILDVLSRILEKEQIPHLTCSKGRALIDIYKEKHAEVALVMLDANLDDMSGYEVAKALRAFESLNKIPKKPIICVSGDSGLEHTKNCENSQINLMRKYYLVTKPVKREDYLKSIRQYIV